MDPIRQATIATAASFLFVTVVFALIYLLYRSRGPKPLPSPPPPRLPIAESASFDPSLRISMSVLKSACGNFSPDLVIGDGGFGLVYKAVLPNSTTVAIKKLSPDAFHGFREFAAEMETLAKILHPNLVKILGFCISGLDRLLVYEFLPNGSLDQWLHEDRPPLPWPTRLGVVRGVAAGLAFLHDECRPCIIHRDIKSSNVLLDSVFRARIADFGLARTVDGSMSHVSTQVAGTMGYMPPEYRNGLLKATVQADVYSFGVMMLEVATGRRPNLRVSVEEEGGVRRDMWLEKWVRWLMGKEEEGRWKEVVDPLMEEVREEEVKGFLEVALRCAANLPKERPLMVEVVGMLKQL